MAVETPPPDAMMTEAAADRPRSGYVALLIAAREQLRRDMLDAPASLAGGTWEAAQLANVRRINAELARLGSHDATPGGARCDSVHR